jgi:hypothetical protein
MSINAFSSLVAVVETEKTIERLTVGGGGIFAKTLTDATNRELDSLYDRVRSLHRSTQTIFRRMQMRQQIAAASFALCYASSKNMIPLLSLGPNIATLDLKRRVRIVSNIHDWHESCRQDWIIPAQDASDERLTGRNSWVDALKFDCFPSEIDDSFPEPSKIDPKDVEEDTDDGYRWSWLAPVDVKLFYPILPNEPPDGLYYVVYSRTCTNHPDSDVLKLRLVGGPASVCAKIQHILDCHGGNRHVAIWHAFALVETVVPPEKRRRVVRGDEV